MQCRLVKLTWRHYGWDGLELPVLLNAPPCAGLTGVCHGSCSYVLAQDSMSTTGYLQKRGHSSAAPPPTRWNLSWVASHQSCTAEESPPPSQPFTFCTLVASKTRDSGSWSLKRETYDSLPLPWRKCQRPHFPYQNLVVTCIALAWLLDRSSLGHH